LNDCTDLESADELLIPGQLIQCVIEKIQSNGRVIKVLWNHKNASVTNTTNVTANALKAGCLVNAHITDVSETSVWVQFLGVFEGSVTWAHAFGCGSAKKTKHGSVDLTTKFKIGQKVWFSNCVNSLYRQHRQYLFTLFSIVYNLAIVLICHQRRQCLFIFFHIQTVLLQPCHCFDFQVSNYAV
jgi:hypothetical protein